MKKLYLILIVITTLIGSSCKKPRLGNYKLTLIEDSGHEWSTDLTETKVKKNIIYYQGYYTTNGYLKKSKNNVSGQISIEDTKPSTNVIIYLTGKIRGVDFLQYEITGTYTTSSNYSGTFIMTRYK